jgi:uncharacterized protein
VNEIPDCRLPIADSLRTRRLWICLFSGAMPLMFGCDSFFYYPNAVQYASPEEQGLEYESIAFRARDGTRLHGWFFPAVVSGWISVGTAASNPADVTDASGLGNPNPGVPALRSPAALNQGAQQRAAVPQEGPRGACGPAALGWAAQERAAVPQEGPRDTPAAGTVLHLHGNAGNITGHFLHTSWLPAAGWNVLCFDYRGYGRSEGRVSRAGTIMDAHAALDHLLQRPDVDSNRIVAFGQSLGGAIGIVLAAERREVRGLAVDGAFDSYRRIASWHVRRNPLLLVTAWWYPRVAVNTEYDPIEAVGRISPRPIFIMHGTADRVVDPAMARRLYDAAGEPKELWLVEGADHYGAMQEHAEEANHRLLEFFRRSVTGP